MSLIHFLVLLLTDRMLWNRYHNPAVRAAVAKYAAVAEKIGIKPVVLAVAWAKQCFFNQSVIVGANSMEVDSSSFNPHN